MSETERETELAKELRTLAQAAEDFLCETNFFLSHPSNERGVFCGAIRHARVVAAGGCETIPVYATLTSKGVENLSGYVKVSDLRKALEATQ